MRPNYLRYGNLFKWLNNIQALEQYDTNGVLRTLAYVNSSNRLQLSETTIPVVIPDNLILSIQGKSITLTKGGISPRCGTFNCNGATPVIITTSAASSNMIFIATLSVVGGTVGAMPTVKTINAGVSFTVAGTALDTSVYNWAILTLQ